MADGPFRKKVRELNRKMRFSDMAYGCEDARSSAWWNNVANGRRVSPPPPEILGDIAKLFEVPRERVAEMVAEDWYGVRADDGLSSRVRALQSSVDVLSDEDFDLVERLTHRLATATAALDG